MNLKKNVQGIALLDVLISLIVILVSVAAYANLGMNLIQKAALINQNLQALNFAQSKLEYFKSYQTLATTTGKLAYADIVSGSDTPAVSGSTTAFTRTWTVTDYPNAASPTAPTYKFVDMIVSWNDNNNVANTVELVTIIARVDPTAQANIFG